MPESPRKTIETSEKPIETSEKTTNITLDTKPQTIQISNVDCVCNTGKWCEDCYGEYDLFD